ncbi:hypothetical protein E2C01_073961 [Portunus trituberculatus]|uniref:Uncharacterized protein n=1 Tax=Portunus trituberculatus TaxID=210409 RepID=A0A5B7IAW5_PORTR|nr:hypothetical protein [Portunus trituberculatus]
MNIGYSFNSYIRGRCVVENGNILRGPPRRVKVSVGDPNDTRMCCCCWPRGPRFNKVAGFRFDHHKNYATLQKYASLESAMFMDGMAFMEYWAPGERVVKMRDRQSDKFLLQVTETSFSIVTKDRPASGGEEPTAPEKIIQKAPKDKGVYSKFGPDEDKVNSNNMISLSNSFKKSTEEPSNCSLCKEVPAARKQQSSASRAARHAKRSNNGARRVRHRKKGKRF